MAQKSTDELAETPASDSNDVENDSEPKLKNVIAEDSAIVHDDVQSSSRVVVVAQTSLRQQNCRLCLKNHERKRGVTDGITVSAC